MLAVMINGRYIREAKTLKIIPYRSKEVAQMEIDIHCADGHAKQHNCRIVKHPEFNH